MVSGVAGAVGHEVFWRSAILRERAKYLIESERKAENWQRVSGLPRRLLPDTVRSLATLDPLVSSKLRTSYEITAKVAKNGSCEGLVWFRNDVQRREVRTLGADISDADHKIAGDLTLNIQVPGLEYQAARYRGEQRSPPLLPFWPSEVKGPSLGNTGVSRSNLDGPAVGT